MAKNIITLLIFSISYDINMYHYIHQWEWKYFVNVCYGVLTPNAKRIRASHHSFRITCRMFFMLLSMTVISVSVAVTRMFLLAE